jgi:23S rRNA (pseudouridine1915-N3)-methyltransferase
MNAAIVCVGRLKESWWRDAQAEYVKRLSRFMNLEVVEVQDLPEPARSSQAQQAQIIEEEGRRILSKIRPEDGVVALCIDGKAMDSVAFSQRVVSEFERGRRVVFVIGGSLGLSAQVRSRADWKLSFSPMTFPHQLARIVLLEQLYRSMKIASNERYHK